MDIAEEDEFTFFSLSPIAAGKVFYLLISA